MCILRSCCGALQLLEPIVEPLLRVGDPIKAQQHVQLVVKVLGLAAQHPAELVVGQQRPVHLQRSRPTERIRTVFPLGAVALRPRRVTFEVGAGRPVHPDGDRAAILLGQFQLDRRIIAAVQVPPVLRPHLVPVEPTVAFAGQREFERLGDCRLTGAVAPGDHHETGSGHSAGPGSPGRLHEIPSR